MMMPTRLEIIAKNKTPNALISLIAFISGFISLLAKLHKCSITVLNISAPSTIPMHSKMQTHSIVFSLKIKPAHNTNNEMMICILKLISETQMTLKPSKACNMLCLREYLSLLTSKVFMN